MDVQFVSGDIYRYDVAAVGERRLEKMRELARCGRGLAAYIGRHVREDYSSKRTLHLGAERNAGATKKR